MRETDDSASVQCFSFGASFWRDRSVFTSSGGHLNREAEVSSKSFTGHVCPRASGDFRRISPRLLSKLRRRVSGEALLLCLLFRVRRQKDKL